MVNEPKQPAKSDTTLTLREDGLTISVPPAGIIRGSKGLIVLGALLCLLMLFLMVLTISEANNPETPAGAWLMVLPFLALGIGSIVVSINLGRRRAIIDVVGRTLLVTRAAPFGQRQDEFHADNLDAIKIGWSGWKMNRRHIMQLQIIDNNGRKTGLLSQRREDELEWIAATLRRALNVSA